MFECQRVSLRNMINRLMEECNSSRELKQIHAYVITSPHLFKSDHDFLISRLLFFCSVSDSTDSLRYAADVFRLFHKPNVFFYNAMIRAYATRINEKHGCSSFRAFNLYKQMLCDGIAPDCITFPFLLKESVKSSAGFVGRSIHAHVVQFGLQADVFVGNSLIALYSECGSSNNALRLFDEMPCTDIVSWNSIVIGCLRNGLLDCAVDLFSKMEEKNIISWNSIITGLFQGGRPKEALIFFHEMQLVSDSSLARPDKITIASVISACAAIGAIDHGKWVHSFLKRSGIVCDMVIGTALVDMYGKCGCVQASFEVFREMPKKDVLAWTAMISVFALHGYSKEAFNLFAEMEALGVRPNVVTFVGLLSACAHSGLVEKGRWCFDKMRTTYSIEPQVQHYACLVDIFSRAGLLDEAESLIRSMPMKPDVFVWGALLGGCQMHKNVELGERVFEHLVDLDPMHHAYYVNLCDIYAKAGRFDDVKRTRDFMTEKGIKKTVPGCSMIEVDGTVHEFSMKGSPELVSSEIKCILEMLSDEIKGSLIFSE